MEVVRIDIPAESAVEASQTFYSRYLPAIRKKLSSGADIMLVFSGSGHSSRHMQRGWRLAITGELARDYVPARVNTIAAADDVEIAAMYDYLRDAPGITGQYFECDGDGAGNPLA